MSRRSRLPLLIGLLTVGSCRYGYETLADDLQEVDASGSAGGAPQMTSMSPDGGTSGSVGGTAGVSMGGSEPAPRCDDGIRNGAEADIDCGGSCEACAPPPFAAPVRLNISVADKSDQDPTLSSDLLEMFFTSARDGGPGFQNIWRTTRPSVDDSWSAPVLAQGVNSSSTDAGPELSGDGLTLWFQSERNGPKNLFVSTRSATGEVWSPPVEVMELNTSDSELAPATCPDGLNLFFARNDQGEFNLFESTRADIGSTWSAPRSLSEINSDAPEWDPACPNEDVLYYARDHDLFQSRRSANTGFFEDEVPLTELNTEFSEGDPWVSPDLSTIFFHSDRDGSPDLYMAERQP